MVYHVVVDVVLHRHRGIVVETCWVAFDIGAEAASSFLWYVLLQFGSVRSFVRSVGGARFDTETSVTAQMIFLSNALFGTFYQAVNYYCDKR